MLPTLLRLLDEKKSSGSRWKLNRDGWSVSKEDKVKISPESLFCSLIHRQ